MSFFMRLSEKIDEPMLPIMFIIPAWRIAPACMFAPCTAALLFCQELYIEPCIFRLKDSTLPAWFTALLNVLPINCVPCPMVAWPRPKAGLSPRAKGSRAP